MISHVAIIKSYPPVVPTPKPKPVRTGRDHWTAATKVYGLKRAHYTIWAVMKVA